LLSAGDEQATAPRAGARRVGWSGSRRPSRRDPWSWATGKYWYDPLGNLPLGNLDCVTTTAGSQADCSPSDGATASASLVADHAYDSLNRLADLRSFAAGTRTDTADYTYDALDRTTREVEDHAGSANDRTTSNSFLGLSNLITQEQQAGGTDPKTKTYGYDAYGQRGACTRCLAVGTKCSFRTPSRPTEGRRMSEQEMRDAWISFRRSASDQAVAGKESQAALFALFDYYRALSPGDRAIIDRLLVEQLTSDDETDRFDALAILREFRIASALPALRALADRLEVARGPSAPYEWAKVNRLIGLLTEAQGA